MANLADAPDLGFIFWRFFGVSLRHISRSEKPYIKGSRSFILDF
jgi:hypothetical protein